MTRTNHLVKMTEKCFGCHNVRNADLVNAGHKTGEGFEIVGRSIGAVRHNFHEDQSTNSEGPTLWTRRDGGDPVARRRVKYMIGLLMDTQISFATLSKIEDEEVLESDYAEGLLSRAEPTLEILEILLEEELIEDETAAEQLEEVLGLVEEGLDADFVEEEGREALAEAAETIGETVAWFAEQDGSTLEGLVEFLMDEEIIVPKGTPYERK